VLSTLHYFREEYMDCMVPEPNGNGPISEMMEVAR